MLRKTSILTLSFLRHAVVGFILSGQYVLESLNNSLTFVIFSDLSNKQTALSLSAGKIITSLSDLRNFYS